jgi:hypothetical protein
VLVTLSDNCLIGRLSRTVGGAVIIIHFESQLYFYDLQAKLPRGIMNIRPHLKNVDNVPLLVPLFTDCTPQGIKKQGSSVQ